MSGGTNVMPFELTTIPIVLHKEIEDTTNEDYENHPVDNPKYRSGFRIGGGIDQDIQKCPYGYTDNGAYVTFVYPQSPAEDSGLKVNDKLIQVNGHDLQFATHKKIVEVIHKYPVLNMLIHRAARSQAPSNGRSSISSSSQNGHYNPVVSSSMGQNPAGPYPTGQNSMRPNSQAQSPMGQYPTGQNSMRPNPMGQNPAGQYSTGQSSLIQNAPGQNLMGQYSTGQNSMRPNIMGQNPAGQYPTGQNSMRQSTMGQNSMRPMEQPNYPPRSNYAPNPYPQLGGQGNR